IVTVPPPLSAFWTSVPFPGGHVTVPLASAGPAVHNAATAARAPTTRNADGMRSRRRRLSLIETPLGQGRRPGSAQVCPPLQSETSLRDGGALGATCRNERGLHARYSA